MPRIERLVLESSCGLCFSGSIGVWASGTTGAGRCGGVAGGRRGVKAPPGMAPGFGHTRKLFSCCPCPSLLVRPLPSRPRATLTANPGSCRGVDGTAGLRHAVSCTGSGAISGRNDQSFQDGVRRRRTHPGGLDEQPSAWCSVRESHERLLDHRSHLRQSVREGVAVGGLA